MILLFKALMPRKTQEHEPKGGMSRNRENPLAVSHRTVHGINIYDNSAFRRRKAPDELTWTHLFAH